MDRREALQLFRFCHIKGLLNEDLARNIVQQFSAAKPRTMSLIWV